MTALYSQKNAAQSRIALGRDVPDRARRPLRGPRGAPREPPRPSRRATRQWSSISATNGAAAANTPAARSSGIAIGSSNESSLTAGHRSARAARVASSVQSATTTSAAGQRSASASRHCPSTACRSLTRSPRRAPGRSGHRPRRSRGGPWPRRPPRRRRRRGRRQRDDQPRAIAAAGEHLTRGARDEHRTEPRREQRRRAAFRRGRTARPAAGRTRARARAAAGRTHRSPADRPWSTTTPGSCQSRTPSLRSALFTSGSQKPSRYTSRVRSSSSRR